MALKKSFHLLQRIITTLLWLPCMLPETIYLNDLPFH